MTQTLRLTGLPPSTNNLWRHTRAQGKPVTYRTKRYMTWLQSSGWQVKEQAPERIEGPIELSVRLERPKRKRDLDNCLKALQDLLVEHQLIEDDDKIMKLTIQWADVTGTLIEYKSI